MTKRTAKRSTKRRPRLSRLDQTAYHEAGHAVAYFLNRLPFRYVTIVPKGDSLGHIMGEKLSKKLHNDVEYGTLTPRQRDRIDREIMGTLGGAAAVAVVRNRRKWDGADSDVRRVFDFADRILGNPEAAGAFFKMLWVSVRDCIAIPYNFRAVEALAGELLKCKRVTGREAREIIDRAIMADAYPGKKYDEMKASMEARPKQPVDRLLRAKYLLARVQAAGYSLQVKESCRFSIKAVDGKTGKRLSLRGNNLYRMAVELAGKCGVDVMDG